MIKTLKKLFACLSKPLPSGGVGVGSTDPFPAVDTHKYAENMTVFGQVRKDGKPVADAVVAVYCGDELRGKGSTFDSGSHTAIFYFQVWGDTNGEALVFKVFTGGETIMLDQGLVYQMSAEVGSPDDYYSVDLPYSSGATFQQTVMLVEGWNWVSGFLQQPLPAGTLAGGSSVSRIVSQTQEQIRDPQFGMVGNLTALQPGMGYKVLVEEACTRTFSGPLCSPATTVTLHKGWNWIGYLLPQAKPVATALKNLKATVGDRLVSPDSFAEYGTGGWEGSLTAMQPGKAYMYYRAGSDTAFTYSDK